MLNSYHQGCGVTFWNIFQLVESCSKYDYVKI